MSFDAVKLAWSKGTHGDYMQVFSGKDGTKLAEKKLAYVPAFDSLLAADNRRHMTTQCGSILCYEGR